jgi:hypothetical protein
MSAKKKSGSGETNPEPRPAEQNTSSANPATPASLTPAQFQDWSFALKKVSDSPWLLYAVGAAGVAALLEIVHLLFLFGKWFYYFLR